MGDAARQNSRGLQLAQNETIPSARLRSVISVSAARHSRPDAATTASSRTSRDFLITRELLNEGKSPVEVRLEAVVAASGRGAGWRSQTSPNASGPKQIVSF